MKNIQSKRSRGRFRLFPECLQERASTEETYEYDAANIVIKTEMKYLPNGGLAGNCSLFEGGRGVPSDLLMNGCGSSFSLCHDTVRLRLCSRSPVFFFSSQFEGCADSVIITSSTLGLQLIKLLEGALSFRCHSFRCY